MRKFLMSLLPLLVACGGGGGDSAQDFSGEYSFASALRQDTCGSNFSQEAQILYRVQQSGDNIVVTNLSTNATLQGSTVGNGWLASVNGTSDTCAVNTQVSYDGNTLGSVAISQVCPGIGNCVVEYASVVDRR